jgi:hypothetical protein
VLAAPVIVGHNLTAWWPMLAPGKATGYFDLALGSTRSFATAPVGLFENSRAWNGAFIPFGEGLDFSTSMGKRFYLSSAFAEFERDCNRDRVRAGM